MLFFCVIFSTKIIKYYIEFFFYALMCIIILYTKSNFLLLNNENIINAFYCRKKKPNKLSINALYKKI